MSAVLRPTDVLQGDQAQALPRHDKESQGPSADRFGSTPFFLYVFVSVIILLHAVAFVAWFIFFLRDLATNKTASIKTPGVKRVSDKKDPSASASEPFTKTTSAEGVPSTLYRDSLRQRKPNPSQSSVGSS
ncbi:hypothetical protein BESB_059570 [Besnoitia besnoiti]|uniref:Transmembrane protein n=1 Tax=Besnoitia besnoiti TaxID=94643 RepID=A0A2A9MI43_BESBE|nr:hypothetical protein BESB_059570 [Besnoitia besnoiti]PFH35070.1 hypothetical protein BESB_059570 [Besnoitia besnoiti]